MQTDAKNFENVRVNVLREMETPDFSIARSSSSNVLGQSLTPELRQPPPITQRHGFKVIHKRDKWRKTRSIIVQVEQPFTVKDDPVFSKAFSGSLRTALGGDMFIFRDM